MLLYETEYFLAIVAAQNMNRAAQSLYISPSALSQFLSRLERRLGATLIIRGKDSLQLTPAGAVFYEAASQIEQVKSDMRSKLNELLSSGNNNIRIGVSGRRGLAFASHLWPMLFREFPDYAFRLTNDLAKPIYEQVSEGTLDFGIVALDETRQQQFRFFPLHHEEIGLLIPEDHPLLKTLADMGVTPNDPADINLCRDVNIILNQKGTLITRSCVQYFKQEGFYPYRISYSMQASAPEVARISSSVTMCSEGIAHLAEGMVFQRLNRPHYYDLGLLCRSDRELSALDKRLIELAEQEKAFY